MNPLTCWGRCNEWRINVETGDITEGPLHDYYSDFSRINEAYAGSKTRYTYSSEFDQTRAITFKSIMKFDRETRVTHCTTISGKDDMLARQFLRQR